MDNETDARLKLMSDDIHMIRTMLGHVLGAVREAESEVPEKMRRFANYYHDVVHIKGEYVSLGITPPKFIDEEMERCHDRMRQVLKDLHTDGNAFEKIRREMAKDPENRFDHTRQLKGPANETRPSPIQQDGIDEGGTEVPGGEPDGSR